MSLKSIVNTLAVASLSVAILFMLYVGYLLLEPFTPPTLTPNPLPILNPNHQIKAGEPIITKVSYCIHKRVPSTTTRRYEEINNARRVYFLSTTESAGSPVGCGAVTSNTTPVPIDIFPGRYKVVLTSTFKVNALKSVTVTYETEEFEIIK